MEWTLPQVVCFFFKFYPGIIDLTNCTRVSGSAPIKGHKHVLDVCTKDRRYHLAADTPTEKHNWMEILNELLFSNEQNAKLPEVLLSFHIINYLYLITKNLKLLYRFKLKTWKVLNLKEESKLLPRSHQTDDLIIDCRYYVVNLLVVLYFL